VAAGRPHTWIVLSGGSGSPDSIISHPVDHGGDEVTKKVSSEFVVARGNVPEILELAVAALNDVAAFVNFLS
jgi:hypothetical protein